MNFKLMARINAYILVLESAFMIGRHGDFFSPFS